MPTNKDRDTSQPLSHLSHIMKLPLSDYSRSFDTKSFWLIFVVNKLKIYLIPLKDGYSTIYHINDWQKSRPL